MDDRAGDPPDEFVELVRDALIHLYDPSHLQTHELLGAMEDAGSTAATRGKRLYEALLDAIETLRPVVGTDAQSRAWRAYRILELRYIDGREAASVMTEVALSKNQYHRDHNRALLAVASLLWERWHLAGRWQVSGVEQVASAESGRVELARMEVEQLLASGSSRTDHVDLAEVLSSVGDLLKPLCNRHAVSLRADLSVRLPAIVCSRVALRQALVTILSTVIGAAAPGPVDIALSTNPGWVVVRVTAILDAAVRPGPLALEHGLPFVEALQGTLNVTTSGSPERINVEFALPTSHGTSLLVVDNNPDFIRLVDRYVGRHGWEIVGAPDVDRASALLGQIHPTAILLDLVIPDRDGWEFLVTLKGAPETRDIPVIVCSVVREPEVALSLGATACLQKPIDQEQLLAVLREVMTGSHRAT